MKSLISIIITCFALSANAGNIADESVMLRDMRTTDFVSNSSSTIEHCVFSDKLTVNGSANVYHSKIKYGVINGSLDAHGIDARFLSVAGSASFKAKSDVAELSVSGSLMIDNSYIDIIKVEGAVFGNETYIKKITATGDLHFVDSDLGKVFINHDSNKKEATIIKLFGKTTIRHLTIDSPLTAIYLDDVSRKTFNKAIVKSNGKVEYK